jgi:hypothetical protein
MSQIAMQQENFASYQPSLLSMNTPTDVIALFQHRNKVLNRQQ